MNQMRNPPPGEVHDVLRRHLLADGLPIVFDLARSHGPWLHDARSGGDYLDVMSFFASLPLGFNHPGLRDPAYLEELHAAAAVKVANPDVYTASLAGFVDAFARLAGHDALPHFFFVEGGALAVENALKAAFDWKVQRNLAAGRGARGGETGQVLHLREAFHGRTGYTLSLTNTDARKIAHFPKFDWPRVLNPKIVYPLDDPASRRATLAAEEEALAAAGAALRARAPDVACILVEPIQSEGGDNHFRPEFLQGLRRLADEHDAILVFDEVQTGFGLTGTMWAFEQLGVVPDAVCFAKKVQVGGLMASRRFDEVDSVFKVASRINSTFGGNLCDMVRARRYLEIVAEERLLENVRAVGARLLAGLGEVAARRPAIRAPRGRGLMIAFDLPTREAREAMRDELFRRGVLILRCGERSLRLRPVLDFPAAAADRFVALLDDAAAALG
jgi:L-lysine 6-transaminase